MNTEELAKHPLIEYRDNEDVCSEHALRLGHGIGANGCRFARLAPMATDPS